jgi:hypothetical protein
MGRGATHGKFGEVLGAFEEERRDERVREVRREEGRRERETGEEFDEDSSDEEEEEDEKKETGDGGDVIVGGGTVEETLEAFERAIREKWLAGLEDVSTSLPLPSSPSNQVLTIFTCMPTDHDLDLWPSRVSITILSISTSRTILLWRLRTLRRTGSWMSRLDLATG